MADESINTNAQTSEGSGRRRSSFAGQTFADLFGTGNRQQPPRSSETSQTPPMQNPIANAAQQANQRRLSLTTLGLSGSPNQTSPFGSLRSGRRESISSSNTGSVDESAIVEDDVSGQKDSNPTTPFGRRMSFGARALRDVRGGAQGQNGRSPSAVNGSGNAAAPPKNNTGTAVKHGTISSRDVKGRGASASGNPEGFNWADNFRTRAERSSSIAGFGMAGIGSQNHTRAKSVATMEPPKEMPSAPVSTQPKEVPALQRRPDHFQERILKGDFYMD